MSTCAPGAACSAACTSACTSAATTPAIIAATAISPAHRSTFYDDEDEKRDEDEEKDEDEEEDEEEEDEQFYGNITVNLKGTKTEIEEVKGWFKRLFVADKEWEEEIVTHTQYLKKIYDVFSELGYKNVLYLDLNNETVYEDEENTDEDFDTAIKAALEKVESSDTNDYNVAISLDTTGDEEENILVSMASKHKVGEHPLSVEIKTTEDPIELLKKIGSKIDEHFETEQVTLTDEDGDEVE